MGAEKTAYNKAIMTIDYMQQSFVGEGTNSYVSSIFNMNENEQQ